MGFAEAITSANVAFFTTFGREISYLPYDETPLTVTGIFTDKGDATDGDFVASVQDAAELILLAEDVPEPSYQDTVEVDGATWVIVSRVRGAGETWTLSLRRNRG